MRNRLCVEIGETHVEFELFDSPIDLVAVHGENGDRHARKKPEERTAELRDDRERGRNCADPETAGQAFVNLLEPAAKILDLRENPMGVLQGHLALRGQTNIAMAAVDDWSPKIFLQEANGG